MSLRFKLITAFLVIAALLVGVSYYQIISMQRLSTSFSNLVNQDFARINALDDINLSSAKLRDQRVEYQQDVTAGQTSKAAAQKAAVTAQATDLRNKTQAYLSLTKTDNPNVGQQTVNDITAASDLVVKNTLAVVAGQNTTAVQNALRDAQATIDQAVDTASSADRSGISRGGNAISKTVEELMWTIVGLAIFVSVLAVVLGALVAARISRSLGALRSSADRIANGDFSQTASVIAHDEIGELGMTFNRMAERLKDSYRRLALARQRDDAMLEGMSEGLVATDEKNIVVVINKVAVQLLGLSDETAAIGKSIQEVYQLYDAEGKNTAPIADAERPSNIALATGQEAGGVFGFHIADGKAHQLSVSASPVKLEGKVVGVVTILRDVTKEKEIDRMKTEFISLASHQLRTPLSAIKWFSEMLVAGDAGELQPEQLDFAKNIADSTERMIALVNALLNISRIESGRIMVDPKPTDLKELVSGITTDLRAKTEEKQQSLIISVHEDLPKINLDPRLIGQVYLNLLTNAIKYTPKGGEITVFISKKDDQIISQVADNGYGIPKEQQARIFQKFFRAANAVKVETDGTGLGLYLIKAIVESSGGKIWFESEENKGTTFWFSIPMSGMKPKEGEVTLDV